MNLIIKKTIEVSGLVLAVLSIVFVIIKFYDYLPEIKNINIETFTLVNLIIIGAFVYFISSFFLVLSWKSILKQQDVKGTLVKFYFLYGVSNLAKYIPGNIFQYAGRQVVSLSQSMDGKKIAKSMGLEVLTLALNGCLSGILVLVYIYSPTIQVFLIFPFFFLILYALLGKYLLLSFFYQLVFLVINAILFLFILSAILEISHTDYYIIIIVYIFSWFVGFITPGSPAGMGIRETILLLFLSVYIDNIALLSAVIICRIISVCGDVLFFICAKFIGVKYNFSSNIGV